MTFLPEGCTGPRMDPSCLGSDALSHRSRAKLFCCKLVPHGRCFKPHRLLAKYQHHLGVASHDWLPTQEKSPGSDFWKKNCIQPQPAPPGSCPADRAPRRIKHAHCCGQARGFWERKLAGRGGAALPTHAEALAELRKKPLTTCLISSQNPLC